MSIGSIINKKNKSNRNIESKWNSNITDQPETFTKHTVSNRDHDSNNTIIWITTMITIDCSHDSFDTPNSEISGGSENIRNMYVMVCLLVFFFIFFGFTCFSLFVVCLCNCVLFYRRCIHVRHHEAIGQSKKPWKCHMRWYFACYVH